MKTAGVMFDFYDDPSGHLLKELFPTSEKLPEIVKTAHFLSPEERNILRDEAYALIMLNEGKTLRKYACVDAGNTALSVLYFLDKQDSLPTEARKVAAENLLSSCNFYGLEAPDMLKEAAAGMQRTRDSMKQPVVGDEADWAQRTNLVSIRGGADSGRVIPVANQMKTAEVRKPKRIDYLKSWKKLNPEYAKKPDTQGGLTLTNDIRHITGKDKTPAIQNTKAPIDTTSMRIGPGAGDTEVNYKPVLNKAAAKLAKIKRSFHERPAGRFSSGRVVDVSGNQPDVEYYKAASSHYALGDKYPIDSYPDVKKAIEYFSENYGEMSPPDRHEYCVKTAARAEELGIEVPDLMQRYGSTEYAPDLEAHIINRKAFLDKETGAIYSELFEKRAELNPEQFAQVLAEVDDQTGIKWDWDGQISDPWFATFGGNSEKEKIANWYWEGRTGDYVTADQIKRLAQEGMGLMKKQFSCDLATAFQKDPFTIFDSLPDDSKILISRLANSEFDSIPNN